MNRFLMVSLMLFSALCTYGYDGRVYIDADADGLFDKGEKCLAGVCVSDGRNVVKTSVDGSFSLPGYGKEKFIFITVPAGYKTFDGYYRRIEKGVTGYDFALYPHRVAGKDGSHKFIHISDTEISGVDGHEEWAENIRKYSEEEGVGFVVHTGDICYEAGLKSHIVLMNTAKTGVPVFYCIGNHDLVKGQYGEELFENTYGPVWYSFDMGNVHYVVTPMWHGDYAPGYTQEDVYDWLENDLAMQEEGKPVIIFNHNLAIYDENFVFRKNDNESMDLDAHNLKAWIYGHWHVNHIRKHKSAYSICTSSSHFGGIDHSSSAFRVIGVDGQGDVTSDLRYTLIDKYAEIVTVDRMRAAIGSDGYMNVSVNAYCSGSQTQGVRCFYQVEGKSYPSFSLSRNTDFNWSARVKIPEGCAGKTVTAVAEVRFRNGESVVTEEPFVCGYAAPSVSGNLALEWVANVGSNIYMTSPVVEDGRLFVATVDENNAGRSCVLALDVKTGRELWRAPTAGSVKNSIALAAGKVFAQDVFGNLYAFSQTDGKTVWEKKLMVRPFMPTLIEGLVAKDGVVYAGTGTGLCASDAETGREIWRNTEWQQHNGSVSTLFANDNVIIGGTQWGALYANDISTGKCLWSHSRDGLRHRSSSPVMCGGLMYLLSSDSFFIMDPATGDIIVRRKLKANVDVATAPLVTESEIIFGTADNGVMAIDRETLDEKWKFVTGSAIISTAPYTRRSPAVETSPRLCGDTVFVTASDGNVYGLDRMTGKELWRWTMGAPSFASVCVCGDGIFTADFSGNVYSFMPVD